MTVNDETWRAERAVLDAALAWIGPDARWCGPEESALQEAAERLHALIKRDNQWAWIKRSWRDVRQGDIIRPVGMPEHAARVEGIARHTRTTRRVTMQPWVASAYVGPENQPKPFTRDVSNPDGGIEIHMTLGELAAIEALGGWSARMGVIWDE